ncbi:DUF2306 domain-containing protein [Maribacter sp.]|uniref:DUF2306 domain-containing protein n=1 Tax=Maribacter sp. TaxID=1897614 RepID=UPI0025C026F3|nr:DUF2306 domain-containing protein [Maribacter sp.]
MEETIKILIYTHAVFGGIALLAGFVSMVAKKGLAIHKKSGIVFYYTMLISAITAMIVAFLPNHHSAFLFAVGIFSLYFILTGKRALRFKNKNHNFQIDKWISIVMIITGILMIFLPIIWNKSIHIVLCVFAIIGILFSIRDLILYKNPIKVKDSWLKLHLVKMIGGYISATTAFVVVNQFFPSFYGWFIPGIIGASFISFWIRKVNRKNSVSRK